MQLHSEITLSTTKAEYSTLSMSLHALLLIHDLLIEVCVVLGVPHMMIAHVHCHVFQDNSASHQLANDQHLTNHIKYFWSSGTGSGCMCGALKMTFMCKPAYEG